MNFKLNNENNKTIIAYLLVCLLWGSTYLAIRIGVEGFPPFVFAGIRYLAAGALMLVYSYFKAVPIPHKPIDIIKISMAGLFLLVGGNGLVVFAETWVSSGVTSLLVSIVPIFMLLIEVVMRKNTKVSLKTWLGMLIGFGGVAALVYSNSNVGNLDMKGALLLLFAAFMWACGSIYSKTFKAEGSVVAHIAIQMLAGGFVLFIIGGFTGELANIHITMNVLGALSYLIIFGSIVGYSCYIYILKKWPSAKAGTYAYVNPVVAVFLGVIVLKEPISVNIIVSALIILFGVVLVQSSNAKK